jgi:hypothetical protein
VGRGIVRFESVATIEEYVEQTIALTDQPLGPQPLSTPSPLGLVASIDYLDVVWRLFNDTRQGHLFRLQSAQRLAQLACEANTAEEFDARLSTIGDLLRGLRVLSGEKPQRRTRDTPLGAFQAHLIRVLPASSETRIERAIETLTKVLAVRDASQHGDAGRRGADAMVTFGAGYPPPTWAFGWSVVSARMIDALDAIREELLGSINGDGNGPSDAD